MPKLSIYVPNELAERMEAVTANWSAVAQRAFQRELLRIEAMTDSDDFVARLRASRAECRDEDEEAGKEKGADWAREAASWRELQRCEQLFERLCQNVPIDFGDFGKAVLKTDDASELRDFAEAWCDEDSDDPNPEFMEGFIEGAVEVWREVEHRV